MRYFTVALLLSAAALSSSEPRKHELLTKLGLTRVRQPSTHHRKRLAVESRHHTRSDDSHMYIIKLPPKPHYYAHNVPNSVDLPSKNVPVSFKNNGKPAKVYHWNLPAITRTLSTKHKSRLADDVDYHNEVFDKPAKEHKPAKATYYVPAKPKRGSFTKYFPGNGKLHSFYVIEKSKKAHYHRLLP